MELEKNAAVALNKQAPTVEEKDQPMDLDLSSIDVIKDSNTGTEITLYHPISGKDLTTKIRIVGRDSDVFKSTQAEQGRKRMEKAQKGGFRGASVSQSQVEKDGIDLLAACTVGWSNLKVDGQLVPFSTANAAIIYANYPWIKEQVDMAVADRALFTKP
jgi:RNA-splicing ligase RtcB